VKCKWHKYSNCRFRDILGREPKLEDCLFCMAISTLAVAEHLAKIIVDVGAGVFSDVFIRDLKFLFAIRESVDEVGEEHFKEMMEKLREITDTSVEVKNTLKGVLESLDKDAYIG